jgi:hypothetical protein
VQAQRRSRADIVATAFDDAAPIPPWTGRRFSISMVTLPEAPSSFITSGRDAITGVRRIERDPRIVTLANNLNPLPARDGDPNYIVQGNRLIHRAQIMEPVRARAPM